MISKEALSKKNKSLKMAIERCNMYKQFVETYKESKSLDEYATHIKMLSANASESTIAHYDEMINSYKHGNDAPLLSNLYDRLLAADEYQVKLSHELKDMLKEV